MQNENRGKLLSELEESTAAMFTGTIKMSTLGSFGEFYVSAWFMQRNIEIMMRLFSERGRAGGRGSHD